MIITCPFCNKQFEVDAIKIPADGRLLQCGSCSRQWFYKKDEIIEKSEDSSLKKIEIKKEFESKIDDEIENPSNENNEINQKKGLKEFKVGKYLNLFIVIIISLIGIVLILDTFKNQLSNLLPNLDAMLNNLYESLKDIKLFLYDLF